jgi:hypothetical protein
MQALSKLCDACTIEMACPIRWAELLLRVARWERRPPSDRRTDRQCDCSLNDYSARGAMTLIGFAALISMLWLVTNAVRADEAQPTSVPFDISLIHPVNFFHPDKKSITGLSLNVLHGTTTNLYGVELGGAINHASKDAHGIRIAGIANLTGGNAGGIQVAGVWSETAGGCKGLTIGGVVTTCARESWGLHVGGFIAASLMSFSGIQLSLLFNWDNVTIDELALMFEGFGEPRAPGSRSTFEVEYENNAEVTGIQIAGLANSAAYLVGLQVSGLVNRSFQDIEGLQLAGLVNYTQDVNGGQIGVVNISRDTYGTQIGLFNYARRMHGVQIGLINVISDNWFCCIPLVNIGAGGTQPDPAGGRPPENRKVDVIWQ